MEAFVLLGQVFWVILIIQIKNILLFVSFHQKRRIWNLLALKMLRVAGQIASIRRMILVGEYTNGFVSMEDMLRDRSDLFSEHIHVIQVIPTPAKFK